MDDKGKRSLLKQKCISVHARAPGLKHDSQESAILRRSRNFRRGARLLNISKSQQITPLLTEGSSHID